MCHFLIKDGNKRVITDSALMCTLKMADAVGMRGLRKENGIILYIKTVSRHPKSFLMRHLGMREADRRITFRYFLSVTANRYSIETKKNRFPSFFKS